MIYNNNLEALKKYKQDIFEALRNMDDTYNTDKENSVYIEQAKNGAPIVKYCKAGREVYLNSRYNPAKEAEKFMEDIVKMPDESIITMVGLANGAFAKEFLSKNDNELICIIYEPDIDIFMQVINNIDITDILSDERVLLVVKGINEAFLNVCLSKVIQVHNRKTNRHIVLPKYSQLFADECSYMDSVLGEQYDRLKTETSTVATYGIKTCSNSIYNMRYLLGCRSGMDYVGRFPKDMPVIIVSAGPSLDKNIDLLKEAENRALILVVDTAIPRVLEAGIKPDMVISVDYNKSLKHFKNEGVKKLTFLANMDMNTAVLDYVKPDNIIFDSSDSVLWARLFTEQGSGIWKVDTGSSVSTAAIAHMIAWGFKNIILVGQDLALTGNRVHAGEDADSADNNKWATTYVKGIDGQDILTRKDYCIYIRWIEDIAYKYTDIRIIDATEGGALKKNTVVMTLREAIDKYCVNEYNISDIIDSAPRLFEKDGRKTIISALNKLKNDFRNLKKQLSSGISDCRMGSLMMSRGDYNVRELKRINATIGKLDTAIMESEMQNYLAKYVSVADLELADDMYLEEADDIKEAIRMYEKSGSYYSRLSEAIPGIIDILDDCIIRLEEDMEA